MKPLKRNIGLGLDIGQTGARLLELRLGKGGMEISCAAALDMAKEGILDETELYGENGLGKFLKEHGMASRRFCLGLPQYLCTTRTVNDLPADAKKEQLLSMMAYETSQLAGLSEETFLSDFQKMTPTADVPNPVLLGFCRENVAEEASSRCQQASIDLSDMAMGGLALASAFCHLHPDEVASEALQLLVDIGVENSTLVLLCNGLILYTGSLMFGGRRFTQVIAHLEDCKEEQAELLKREQPGIWEGHESSFLLAARQLETELKTALDNWRAGERKELAGKMVDRIWLSGGGANTAGLAKHLERTYGCPVPLLGPMVGEADHKALRPEWTIALGLALQDLGVAAFSVSMATKAMRWYKRKSEQFPFLVWSLLLFFLTLFGAGIAADLWMKEQLKSLEGSMVDLRRCSDIVPKLDATLGQIEYQQRLLSPLVELGGRSKVFMRTLEAVSAAMGAKDWIYFCADEFSYQEFCTVKQDVASPAPHSSMGLFGDPMQEKQDKADTENRVDISSMPLLGKMVVAGFTPVDAKTKYGGVVKLQNNLRQNPLFTGNVDTMTDEWCGRGQGVLTGWNNYLRTQRALVGEHADFRLSLPLSRKLLVLPAEKSAPKKGRGRNKKD